MNRKKWQTNVGTTFTVTLPFEFYLNSSKAYEEENVEKNNLNGVTALLVEDNELNMEIAKFLLENVGIKVTIARNGKEAINIFSASSEFYFDVILMDIMMPVMDGLTATRTIRALDRPDARSIPIIAMTANAFKEDADKCLEAGMNAHMAKPLNMEKLKQTICECLSADK